MKDDLRKQIAEMLSEIMNFPVKPHENPGRSQIASWDSLSHIELILRLEEQFQVRFTIEDVTGIRSLDDIVNLVGVKL